MNIHSTTPRDRSGVPPLMPGRRRDFSGLSPGRGKIPDLDVRIALDDRTRRDAYRLRHLCYASKGYIETRPDEEFSDADDRHDWNTTIVLYDDEFAIASVRCCRSDPAAVDERARNLPLSGAFGPEIRDVLGAGGRGMELCRLVCHPAHSNQASLVFMLFRMATWLGRQDPPDVIASCVRVNHRGFYRRLHFRDVAGPRPYPGLKFETSLMVCEATTFDVVAQASPMLAISVKDSERYVRLLDGERVAVSAND